MNPIEELRQEIRDIPEIVLEMLKGDPVPERGSFDAMYADMAPYLDPLEEGIQELDSLTADMDDDIMSAQAFPDVADVKLSTRPAWDEWIGAPRDDTPTEEWSGPFSPEDSAAHMQDVRAYENVADTEWKTDDLEYDHPDVWDHIGYRRGELLEDRADKEEYPEADEFADEETFDEASSGAQQETLEELLKTAQDILALLQEGADAAGRDSPREPVEAPHVKEDRAVRPWYPDFATSPIAAVAARAAVALWGPDEEDGQ